MMGSLPLDIEVIGFGCSIISTSLGKIKNKLIDPRILRGNKNESAF
jgi:hypothetical protein